MLGTCNTCVRLPSKLTISGATVNSNMFCFVFFVVVVVFVRLFFTTTVVFSLVVFLGGRGGWVFLFPSLLMCLLCVCLFF